jgi:hypothetical protein
VKLQQWAAVHHMAEIVVAMADPVAHPMAVHPAGDPAAGAEVLHPEDHHHVPALPVDAAGAAVNFIMSNHFIQKKYGNQI